MGRRYIIKTRPRYYVERRKDGTFKKWVSRSKSQSIDQRKRSKTTVQSGYGHQGDQKRRRTR